MVKETKNFHIFPLSKGEGRVLILSMGKTKKNKNLAKNESVHWILNMLKVFDGTNYQTERQKDKNSETQKHRNSETQKHRNTETQKHRNTETQKKLKNRMTERQNDRERNWDRNTKRQKY